MVLRISGGGGGALADGLQANTSQQAGTIRKIRPSLFPRAPFPSRMRLPDQSRRGTPKPGTRHTGLPAECQPASRVTLQCKAPLTALQP